MKLESLGIIISLKKFQESKYIISCFTKDYGTVVGIIRKPSSNKGCQPLVPGNIGVVSWYAKLEGQLGSISIEVMDHISVRLHNDRDKLAVLQSMLSLISIFIMEREEYGEIFAKAESILHGLAELSYYSVMAQYCLFELKLLEEIGFGLDLRKCIVSNVTDDLVYVSPKSGCAVSSYVGKPYHDKLFPLPGLLLCKDSEYNNASLLQALKLTGFFLHQAAVGINKERQLDVRNQLLPGLSAQ